MTNLDDQDGRLNQLLIEIDKTAENGCLDNLVSIEVTKYIRELIDMESADAVKQLVDRWVTWVARDNLQPLVNATAEYLRTNHHAVHPLVHHFGNELDLTDALKRTIIEQKIPREYQDIVTCYFTHHYQGNSRDESISDESLRDMSRMLLNLLADEIPERVDFQEVSSTKNQDGKMLADRLFALLLRSERNRRQLEVYRRTSSLLAHMSDERFFPNKDLFADVKKELEKHALPVFVFKLPERQDPETRWHMALMMGYLGGRCAIDPLVQELIGVEATRASRQKMLSEYYLEPSKQHSRESSQILASVVQDARSTVRIIRTLNVIVFGVGIGLLLTGVIVAILATEPSTRLVGALSGLGGLSGVIVELIRNPLDSIQKSLDKLVKTETVFTNFIWELNLNGVYIQSRYVANGILSDVDIAQTVKRMKSAVADVINNYPSPDINQ